MTAPDGSSDDGIEEEVLRGCALSPRLVFQNAEEAISSFKVFAHLLPRPKDSDVWKESIRIERPGQLIDVSFCGESGFGSQRVYCPLRPGEIAYFASQRGDTSVRRVETSPLGEVIVKDLRSNTSVTIATSGSVKFIGTCTIFAEAGTVFIDTILQPSSRSHQRGGRQNDDDSLQHLAGSSPSARAIADSDEVDIGKIFIQTLVRFLQNMVHPLRKNFDDVDESAGKGCSSRTNGISDPVLEKNASEMTLHNLGQATRSFFDSVAHSAQSDNFNLFKRNSSRNSGARSRQSVLNSSVQWLK